MSETGSSDQDTTEEIDDPGRDPKGLQPAAESLRRRPRLRTAAGRADGQPRAPRASR